MSNCWEMGELKEGNIFWQVRDLLLKTLAYVKKVSSHGKDVILVSCMLKTLCTWWLSNT